VNDPLESLAVPFYVVFIFFLAKQNSTPHRQVDGNPKASLVAEGQQGFHLHTSGFEPRTSFQVLGPLTEFTPVFFSIL
jgi:hypothetical protein